LLLTCLHHQFIHPDILALDAGEFIIRAVYVAADLVIGKGLYPSAIQPENIYRAVEGKNQNYLTPENKVPEKTLPYPWESCIISGGSWSWVPNAKYMSPRKVVHMLSDIVCKGGNLLLNIAPGHDGTWDEGAYNMLEGVGEWMDINGEAIYDTESIEPFKEGKVCFTAGKDGAVYLIYLADVDEEKPPSKIWSSQFTPEKGSEVIMLGEDTKLHWEPVGNGFMVEIPKDIRQKPPCENAWVLKISN